MSLMDKIKKAGSIKTAEVMSTSQFFNVKDFTTTEIPIVNIAFSADPNGGIPSGLVMLAGESKSFKTLLMLLMMKSYLNKHPESIAVLYDAEFGITQEYMKTNGIDVSRVLHVPIQHVEELKFDIVSRLEQIERGDKVFVGIDSLGALASKKEVEDAQDEKSVADMSRAKALKSLFRIIGPQFTLKDIPCIAINHVYKELSLYPKTIVGGGTGGYYTSNCIMIVTKSQEKEGNDLVGWNFTLNVEKSRFVREKSKFEFTVLYGGGIQKYSGLFDIGVSLGYITRPTSKTYGVPSILGEKTASRKDLENSTELWKRVVVDPVFIKLVYDNYSYAINDVEETEAETSEINEILASADNQIVGDQELGTDN